VEVIYIRENVAIPNSHSSSADRYDIVFSVELSVVRKIVLVLCEEFGILLSPGGRETSAFKVCTLRHIISVVFVIISLVDLEKV
jgi:hypothetical protein